MDGECLALLMLSRLPPSLDDVLIVPFVLSMLTITAAIRDFETMKAPRRAGSIR